MISKKIIVATTLENMEVQLILSMANRHGLITGATGTGKTVTLQRLAEQFSLAGIPIFLTDVKGDLAGLACAGANSPATCSVNFWDLYGEKGLPLRTTVSEIGPILIGRILEVNSVQQGILNAAFSLADDQKLLLLDLKDLQSLLDWIVNHVDQIRTEYGNFSRSSVGAIQRSILSLSEAGGDKFFSEPALQLEHIMQQDKSGNGIINILDGVQLINNPLLYTSFLLWLLSELFKQLPEVGDLDKPKLIFFFDESHLLFNSASKSLLEKIEQIVRLIRSKGVGIYFVSQCPSDISDNVLSQLSNRIQHALRAFTPKDQKAVKAAAQTFRQNPKINVEKVITELKVGEALISFLDEEGSPIPVEKAKVILPNSRMGAISEQERNTLIQNSAYYSFYKKTVDRESAYEMIKQKLEAQQKIIQSRAESATQPIQIESPAKPRGRPRQSVYEIFIKSTARALGSKLGQQIIRGVLGSIFGSKKSKK